MGAFKRIARGHVGQGNTQQGQPTKRINQCAALRGGVDLWSVHSHRGLLTSGTKSIGRWMISQKQMQ